MTAETRVAGSESPGVVAAGGPPLRATRLDAGTEVESLLAALGSATIAGVDEVGRGAWAGPLTVGIAVASPRALRRLPKGIRDSKELSAVQREELFAPVSKALLGHATGHATPEECDLLGLTAAQRLATGRAFDALGEMPEAIIVDGPIDFSQSGAVCVVDGDRLCVLVAAASVLAKVTRDRLMVAAADEHAGYGFERNKGYATFEHRVAVGRLGLTPIHRTTWAVAPIGAEVPFECETKKEEPYRDQL